MNPGNQSLFHGSAIAFGDKGAVFLRGPSGAGKSDLAFRLIAAGGVLISDDQVEFTRRQDKIFAAGVETIKGLLEVRGVGLVRMPAAHPTPVCLIVDLVSREEVPRLPEWETAEIQGVGIPCLKLHAFDASTPLKILKAMEIAAKPGLLVQ
jgi:serine kinase of HPr protein (carbohydrate metabolism regulator)